MNEKLSHYITLHHIIIIIIIYIYSINICITHKESSHLRQHAPVTYGCCLEPPWLIRLHRKGLGPALSNHLASDDVIDLNLNAHRCTTHSKTFLIFHLWHSFMLHHVAIFIHFSDLWMQMMIQVGLARYSHAQVWKGSRSPEEFA